MNNTDNVFSYTRSDAIEDGVLVDVTNTDEAREAGIVIPVALTRTAYEQCAEWTDDDRQDLGQSTAGRLWDVLFMFALRARGLRGTGIHDFRFTLYCIPRDRTGRPKLVTLRSVIALDERGETVLTIMLPNED